MKERMQIGKLLLMASVTFMAILCELMPSGVLPLIAESFHLNNTEAGALVGVYAISSALFGLPLVAATVEWDRKKLLIFLLSGFAFSNGLVSLAPNYWLALLGRVLGGICVGTLWPMITAYGMAIVGPQHQGRAVTLIMSGITVGMCLGLPVMTSIGTQFGFRAAFALLGILLLGIAGLSQVFLPSVAGEKRSQANSPFTMLKNKGVRLVVLFTFLGVGANYGVYTYITRLIQAVHYPSITQAQLFFGIGSVLAVVLMMKYIDQQFHLLLSGVFVIGTLTMGAFYCFDDPLWLNLVFVLWGLVFGSLSSTFQTATARQVTEGTAVANAVQSCAFNFAIMLGSLANGLLLETYGATSLVLVALVILALGSILTVTCRKDLA